MDIATKLCAVLFCLNFFFSEIYTQIEENDIHINVKPADTKHNKMLRDAFSHFIKDSNMKLFEQSSSSSDENEFKQENELLKLKDLDKALEEIIDANSRLIETFDASQPNSAKMLSELNKPNDFDKNISINDIISNNISRNLFAQKIGAIYDTAPPNIDFEDKIDNLNNEINFADLLSLKPFSDENSNLIDSNSNNNNDKQQSTRAKREDHIKNETESSNSTNSRVSFVKNTSEERNEVAENVLKLMKEDDADTVDDEIIGSLEDIVDEIKVENRTKSTFSKIPAQYIFPLIRASNMASKVLSTGYQTIKNTSYNILNSLINLG